MHRAHRYVVALLLAAAFAAPVSMIGAPAPQRASVNIRVYDRDHKDYHNWDDHDNHTWQQYRSDNHKSDREYRKANKRERSEYWNWRHSHPDRD